MWGGGGRGKVGGGVVMCRTNLYRGGDGGCLHDMCVDTYVCRANLHRQWVGGVGVGGGRGCMHAQNHSADTNSRCFQLRSLCGEDIAAAPLKAP